MKRDLVLAVTTGLFAIATVGAPLAGASPSWHTSTSAPPTAALRASGGPDILPSIVRKSVNGGPVLIEAKYKTRDCAYNKASSGFEIRDEQVVASQGGRVIARGPDVKLRPGTYALKVTITYRSCLNAPTVVDIPEGAYTLSGSDRCDVTAVNRNHGAGLPLMAAFDCSLGGGEDFDAMQNYYKASGSVGYDWNQRAQQEYDGDMYLNSSTNELEYADDSSGEDYAYDPGYLYFDEWIESPGTVTFPAQRSLKNNWTWGPEIQKSETQSITVTSRNSPCVNDGEPSHLRLGMTATQVASLIGYGGHRALFLNQGGSAVETRTYEWCAYSNVLYVYFSGGRVTGWLDS